MELSKKNIGINSKWALIKISLKSIGDKKYNIAAFLLLIDLIKETTDKSIIIYDIFNKNIEKGEMKEQRAK